MISRFIRIAGVFVIICLTFSSVLLSLIVKDLKGLAYKRDSIYRIPATIEDIFYDTRVSYDTQAFEKRIVLAEIDDKSLGLIGQWPIPRTVWATMLDKLNHFGAKVIAFDVLFSEEQPSCSGQISNDDKFAKSIKDFQSKKGNAIILSYSLDNMPTKFSYKEVPDSLYNFILDTQGDDYTYGRFVSKSNFPIKKLLDSEPSLGFFIGSADIDGVFRHYSVISNVGDLYFPSLSLVSYYAYTGHKPKVDLRDNSKELSFEGANINLDFMGNTKIRWLGGQKHFPRESLYNIINAKDDDPKMKEKFKDSLVFVGSSATAAHDLRNTPVQTELPGVYAHMNMVSMLLNKFSYQNKDTTAQISWIMIICGSVLMILIQIFGNAIFDLIGVIILSATMYYIDKIYFLPKGYEVKLFFALLAVALIYLWNTFLSFYITSREKKQIKGTFSRYVSPAVVDEMLADPEKLKVGGEKKEITVFFSDVRDFTSISEALTPEMLSKSINFYMSHMTEVLFKYFGTVDKYIGDAIVAFWNAPLNVDNHAYQAVKASLEMIEILPEVNKTLVEWGVPEFKHGIGLNTGDCNVGNMGSDKIFAYTALGDSMNLGARLESLCKYYGVQLNVSEFTIKAIPEDLRKEFSIRTLDKVKVKGKKEAVTIYEILHSFHPFRQDQDALAKFNNAFQMYLNKEFTNAQGVFQELKTKYPEDKSSTRMFDICTEFIKTPPPADWDGAYVHTRKS